MQRHGQRRRTRPLYLCRQRARWQHSFHFVGHGRELFGIPRLDSRFNGQFERVESVRNFGRVYFGIDAGLPGIDDGNDRQQQQQIFRDAFCHVGRYSKHGRVYVFRQEKSGFRHAMQRNVSTDAVAIESASGKVAAGQFVETVYFFLDHGGHLCLLQDLE